MRHGFCFHFAGVHSSFIGFVGREAQLRLHMEMVVLQDSKKRRVQQPKKCSGDYDNVDASQEHGRATRRGVEGNKRKDVQKNAMEMTGNVYASQAGKKDTGRS